MKAFESMAYAGIIACAKLFSGLIAIKLIAVYLGPDALGLLGQFMSLIAILVALSTGGVTVGLTRGIAERLLNPETRGRLIRVAVTASLFVNFLLLILVLVYASEISSLLFGVSDYAFVLILASLFIFPLGLSGLGQAVLSGMSKVQALAKVHMGGALLGSLIIYAGIVYWQESGAILGLICLAAAPSVFIVLWWVRDKTVNIRDLMPGWHRNDLSFLLKYSGIFIYSISLQNMMLIWIRSNLGTEHGWIEVGYWQAMARMSDAYLQVFIIFLMTYLYPKLSYEKSPTVCIGLILNAYKVIAVPLLIVLLIGFFARDYVVLILLSENFKPVTDLFFLQMIGDFLKLMAIIPGYLVLARSYMPLIIAGELVQILLLVAFNLIFVGDYGAQGVVMAHALSYGIYLSISIIVFRVYIKKSSISTAHNL